MAMATNTKLFTAASTPCAVSENPIPVMSMFTTRRAMITKNASTATPTAAATRPHMMCRPIHPTRRSGSNPRSPVRPRYPGSARLGKLPVEPKQLQVGDDRALGWLGRGHDRAQLAEVGAVQTAQAYEVARRNPEQVVREL